MSKKVLAAIKTVRLLEEFELEPWLQSLIVAGYPDEVIKKARRDGAAVWREPTVISIIEIKAKNG